MSTKAQLREAIKRESRIKSNAGLDSLVDDIVTDILRDYCNLARYDELLVINTEITLVDGQQTYAYPVDYGNLAVLRYGRGPNPTVFRDLILQTEGIRQTANRGYPRFYRKTASGISLWPYEAVVEADQLFIDYYADPLSLYEDEADEFPVPRLESAVKKDAIARVQRFHASTTEAQMTAADSRRSFNAADAAS